MIFQISLYTILFLLILAKKDWQTKSLFGFAVIIFLCKVGAVIIDVWTDPLNSWSHDFNCYYYAADTFGKGLNPYIDEDVITATGMNDQGVVTSGFSILPFKYSPVTLYLFKIFNTWEYYTAVKIFLVLKLIAYLSTVFIWTKYIFKDYRLKTFLLLIVSYGFVSTYSFPDFYSGNISIFEIFTITIASIFLLRKQTTIYCLIILFLSLFKVYCLALIFLPLMVFDWRKVKIILTVLISGGLLFYIYSLIEPLVKSYTGELVNTSYDIGDYGKDYGILLLIPKYIYPFWIIAALTLTVLICRKQKTITPSLIAFGVLIFVLIVPRLPEYVLSMLIVPGAVAVSFIPNRILQSVFCLFFCTQFLGYYHPVTSALLVLGIFTVTLSLNRGLVESLNR